MIDRPWAEGFAREWADCWNAKKLDSLLSHYAPNVVFRSPRISVIYGNRQAFVSGLGELRAYWAKALESAKEVRFEITGIGVGSDALTILYRNHRSEQVCETLVFGDDGKIIEGIVTYVEPLQR